MSSDLQAPEAQQRARKGRVLGDNPLVLISIVLLLIVGIGVAVLPFKQVARHISTTAPPATDLDDQGRLHRS